MSYWEKKGKYQDKADILNKLVPDMGESTDTRIETFRKASNVYYDIHNNGGDNLLEGGARNDEFESLGKFINSEIRDYIEFKEEQQNSEYPEDDDGLFEEACKGSDQMMDEVIEWIESTGFFKEKKK